MAAKLRETYDWIFRDAERPPTQAEIFRRVCYALSIQTFLATGLSLETSASDIEDATRKLAHERQHCDLEVSERAEIEGDSDTAAKYLQSAIELFREYQVVDTACRYRPFSIPILEAQPTS